MAKCKESCQSGSGVCAGRSLLPVLYICSLCQKLSKHYSSLWCIKEKEESNQIHNKRERNPNIEKKTAGNLTMGYTEGGAFFLLCNNILSSCWEKQAKVENSEESKSQSHKTHESNCGFSCFCSAKVCQAKGESRRKSKVKVKGRGKEAKLESRNLRWWESKTVCQKQVVSTKNYIPGGLPNWTAIC